MSDSEKDVWTSGAEDGESDPVISQLIGRLALLGAHVEVETQS